MTDAVQIAIIAATPPTVVAIGAVIIGWLNRRQGQAIEIKVDGKMEELLSLTRSGAHAEGVVEGRERGVVEKQARTAESERVEDRQAEIHRTESPDRR
jgi:hypothetical protein